MNSVEDAEATAREIGFPVVVRPAYTMGGSGSGFCYNVEELRTIAARGLRPASSTKCLLRNPCWVGKNWNWKSCVTPTAKWSQSRFIENVDAVGIHTGDSFCTAPMLISPGLAAAHADLGAQDRGEHRRHRRHQRAIRPQSKDDRIVVIEINPRTSRSSALASKATGFPIAYVSALLAAGITLDELPYWRDGSLDKYTPSGDYVVVKFARWAFEKFKGVEDRLGTQMRAVGEVMSIGKTYKEAFLKAIRSLENGHPGLGFFKHLDSLSLPELMERLSTPTSIRQFIIYEAMRKGADINELHTRTHINPWFLEQMRELVELENEILKYREHILPDDLLRQAKQDGFSDLYLAKLLKTPEAVIRRQRLNLGITQAWDSIPVSGVDNACYYYST